ncbi:MAG: murein hydrolase activator EnvC family protein [Bacillota bacterium]
MRLKQGFAVGLVVVLLLAHALTGFADTLAEQRARYEAVQREIKELEKKINANRSQYNSVTSELRSLDKAIEESEQQLAYLEQRLQTTEAEIRLTEEDLAEAEARLAQRQEALKLRVRALYERGPMSYLEVLIGASSFRDLINRINLLGQVVEHDAVVVDSIKQDKADIELRKEALEAQKAKLSDLHRQTDQQRSSVASRMANRVELQKKLLTDRQAYEAAMAELEATERELERLIREAQGNNPGGATGTGTYVWPAPGYTKINSYFGWRNDPITGQRKHHAGIDIGSPLGAKIVAVDDGTVLFSGWMGSYGQVVIIDHGKGISTVYAHLNRLSVSTNQTVLKGQKIGEAGSTGYSTGPHLHFEFRKNGAKVNPLDYVPR